MKLKIFVYWEFDYLDDPNSPLPSEIELQGYAQNQYTNDRYPWEGKIYRRPAYILDKNDTQENSFSQGKDNTIGYYLKHFDLNPTLQNILQAKFLLVYTSHSTAKTL